LVRTYMKQAPCEIEGCPLRAKYNLYQTENGKKTFKKVCDRHERIIGYENLQRAGGYVGDPRKRRRDSNGS